MSWPGLKNYWESSGIRHNRKSMAIGGGGRFAKLKAEIGRRGDVSDPGAVVAAIGRAKYGKKKFQAMAARGRKRAY